MTIVYSYQSRLQDLIESAPAPADPELAASWDSEDEAEAATDQGRIDGYLEAQRLSEVLGTSALPSIHYAALGLALDEREREYLELNDEAERRPNVPAEAVACQAEAHYDSLREARDELVSAVEIQPADVLEELVDVLLLQNARGHLSAADVVVSLDSPRIPAPKVGSPLAGLVASLLAENAAGKSSAVDVTAALFHWQSEQHAAFDVAAALERAQRPRLVEINIPAAPPGPRTRPSGLAERLLDSAG